MDKLNDLFTKIINKLNKKVDSVEGKQLSSEDFTSGEKTKLQGIADEAQVNTIETISLNGTPVPPDEAKNVEIKAYNEDNKPEVGGRNYILNSADGVDVNVNNTTFTTGIGLVKSKEVLGELYGKKVTVSFDYDATIVNGVAVIAVGRTYQNIGTIKESGKGHISKTLILNSYSGEYNNLYLMYIQSLNPFTGTIKISKVKVELGDIETDWTPAPEDLELVATKSADSIEIGGRNLLLGSGVLVTNSTYQIASYPLTDNTLRAGEVVTISIKGKLGEGKTDFRVFNSAGAGVIAKVVPNENGYGTVTSSWVIPNVQNINTNLLVFAAPIDVTGVTSTIEWIKLERGNKPTDWSPAPEDLQTYLPLYKRVADNDPVQFPTNALSLSFMQGTTPDCPTPDNGGMLLTMRLTGASANNAQLFIPDDASQLNLGAMWMRVIKSDGNYSGWTQIAKISDITTDNFEGVLPIEKGGTGNQGGKANSVIDAILPAYTIYCQYRGDAYDYLHSNVYPLLAGVSDDGKIVFGTTSYGHFISKGNLATKTDYATSTTAGLVKPGTGLSITDDGTLSISQDELQSMIENAVTKAISSQTLQK